MVEPIGPRPVTTGSTGSEMVRLAGGSFAMGTDDREGFPADGEGPVREVRVRPFSIDRHAVSNADFAHFVTATGHVTEAEASGWSFVFAAFLPASLRRSAARVDSAPWWTATMGANWRAPEGPASSIADRMDHPVVHVSWDDAAAYASWAGKRLPTEVEWEYAARGGLHGQRYPWGDELVPDGQHRCNIWQGRFPTKNTADDGYVGTAPVTAFPENGYGLYNMSGNVWEWCNDPWSPAQTDRAIRGGSYLCHESYCNRYRVAARSHNTPDSSSGHLGFRCARGDG